MPKAVENTTTPAPLPQSDARHATRRCILAGTAAALSASVAALPALAAATAGPHPDAALVALCRRCLCEADYVNTAALGEDWSDDEVDAACDPIRAMEEEICAAVPVSVAGLAAKAEVVRRTMSSQHADECCDTRMQLSLFENIEAMAKGAAHG
jgi:hypothetical protein